MTIFIPILLAVIIAAVIQAHIYEKRALKNMKYHAFFSEAEAFEGESIFLYEELRNEKRLPVPYAKVYTDLPPGLKLHLVGDGKRNKKYKESEAPDGDSYDDTIQSIFVLKGFDGIRRRWRVSCVKRGVYRSGQVVIVSKDILGLSSISASDISDISEDGGKNTTLTVLPRAIDLDEHFTSAQLPDGTTAVLRSLITDPMLRAGSRTYTASDPMRSINWKSSAVHGSLMVNIEEPVHRHAFNIILNMQSRSIEHRLHEASNAESIEMCITVCASVLDRIAAENIPVRISINTAPEKLEGYGGLRMGADGADRDILVTKSYKGRGDTVDALRLLAALPLEYSCPIENVLDSAAFSPEAFADGGNIVVISSYICERMIVFYEIMRRQGVNVIFFVTTANQNARDIPEHIPVFYKTFK